MVASSNIQASMDFKYLNDRYQRGKEAIDRMMNEKHILMRASSLNLAHASVLQAQAAMGPAGSLPRNWNCMLYNCCFSKTSLNSISSSMVLFLGFAFWLTQVDHHGWGCYFVAFQSRGKIIQHQWLFECDSPKSFLQSNPNLVFECNHLPLKTSFIQDRFLSMKRWRWPRGSLWVIKAQWAFGACHNGTAVRTKTQCWTTAGCWKIK